MRSKVLVKCLGSFLGLIAGLNFHGLMGLTPDSILDGLGTLDADGAANLRIVHGFKQERERGFRRGVLILDKPLTQNGCRLNFTTRPCPFSTAWHKSLNSL